MTQWPWLMKGVTPRTVARTWYEDKVRIVRFHTNNTTNSQQQKTVGFQSLGGGAIATLYPCFGMYAQGSRNHRTLSLPPATLEPVLPHSLPPCLPLCLPLCLSLCLPAWMVFTVGIHPTVPDWWIDSRAQLNNILRPKNWGLPARMT